MIALRHTIFSICFAIGLFVNAQDIHFTQADMTPLLVNPANAGTEYDIRAILNYRSQWTSANAPFKSMMAAYDMNFKKGKSKKGFFAGGIYLFNDKAGTSNMTTNQANLSVAYHIQLDKQNTLGAGLQGGYFQRTSETANLRWGSQFDGYEYNGDMASGEGVEEKFTIGALDYNTGLVWTYRNDKKYFSGQSMYLSAGLSFQHISKPSYDYQGLTPDRLYNRWFAHSNAIIGLNKDLTLLPYMFYSFQGSIDEFLIGTNFLYTLKQASNFTGNVKGLALGAGTFYRWNDAIIANLLVQYANYTFEFSYDYNISSFSNATGGNGAFEIGIRYVYPSPFGGTKSKSRFN